jgi:hypothetical protein
MPGLAVNIAEMTKSATININGVASDGTILMRKHLLVSFNVIDERVVKTQWID